MINPVAKKQNAKVLDSYVQGGILTVGLDKSMARQGQTVELEYDKSFVRGIVIRKVGTQLKIRITKVVPKIEKT